MRKNALADILFWSLAAVSVVMLVALFLVVGGFVDLEPAPSPNAPAATAAPKAEPEPPTAAATDRTETATRQATSTAQAAAPSKPKPPSTTVVVMSAVRGDSWFSARVGSESGRVLDERVLAQGDSVQLQAARIWLTVGAAGNVDLTVNGKPRAIQPGTVSVVLSRPGSSKS